MPDQARDELADAFATIGAAIGNAVRQALGISAVVAPLSVPVLAGEQAHGTVEVVNNGTADLTDLSGTVTVPGLSATAAVALASLPAGGHAQLPFAVDVAAGQDPGTYDANLVLDLRRGSEQFSLRDQGTWVEVDSGVRITDVGTTPKVGGSAERATVTATLQNDSGHEVRGRVTVDVTPGEPFLIRDRETFDGAKTKKYNVYVDDTLVTTVVLPRTQNSVGTETYQLLVDDPAALDNDGSVRVTFEFPEDADGFYDPSIADTWILPVPDDDVAPAVSASVVDGTPGNAGWYRSDVTVGVDAADNRAGSPAIEIGSPSGWTPYTGPVAVTGEGEHELTYRATDAASNASAERTLPVPIDTSAPATTMSATRGAGVDGADTATLTFAATDATSGVATTVYRIDGGAWETVGAQPARLTGFGDHTIEFASTDVAGNPEPMQLQTVSLADVDTVSALVAPTLSGAARVGSTLTATSGSWNTKGLAYTYQWLRNGSAIGGATGASYRVAAGDIGKRLSVRVTATKRGKAPGVATSSATAPVAKVASRTRLSLAKAKVAKRKPVRVTAVVASTPKATGKVAIKVDGKVVKRVAVRNGRAVLLIRLAKAGRHKIVAVYLGSATVAGSKSAVRRVRVR